VVVNVIVVVDDPDPELDHVHVHVATGGQPVHTRRHVHRPFAAHSRRLRGFSRSTRCVFRGGTGVALRGRMNLHRLFAIAAAPCFAACLAVEPTLESGKAALSPPVCEARADVALATCQSKCDDSLGEADAVHEQCVADANDDFGLYLEYIAATAGEADLGSVGADIQACWEAVDSFDCETIRESVEEYVAEQGIPLDPSFAASWNVLGCNLAGKWGKVTCVTDHAGAIVGELGDGAELAVALYGLRWETVQWLGWLGFCEAQRLGADASHFGCNGIAAGPIQTGCEATRANEYAACRGECLGEPGTACVPAGFPSWVDCGVWVTRPAGDAWGGACDCVSDIFATGECAAWDWENGLFGSRLLNTPCRTDADTAGVMTFLVTKDDRGAPSGHEIRCVAIDEYGVPQVDLDTAVSSSGDDSCRWASDGECDEPRFCDYGTDRSDCGY